MGTGVSWTCDFNNNHNYIKILDSDWSSAAPDLSLNCTVAHEHTLVIGQWYGSCLSNWSTRSFYISNISTCQIVYTTVIFFSNFVIVMINSARNFKSASCFALG